MSMNLVVPLVMDQRNIVHEHVHEYVHEHGKKETL